MESLQWVMNCAVFGYTLKLFFAFMTKVPWKYYHAHENTTCNNAKKVDKLVAEIEKKKEKQTLI